MKEECFDLDLYTWTKVKPTDEVSQSFSSTLSSRI